MPETRAAATRDAGGWWVLSSVGWSCDMLVSC